MQEVLNKTSELIARYQYFLYIENINPPRF